MGMVGRPACKEASRQQGTLLRVQEPQACHGLNMWPLASGAISQGSELLGGSWKVQVGNYAWP